MNHRNEKALINTFGTKINVNVTAAQLNSPSLQYSAKTSTTEKKYIARTCLAKKYNEMIYFFYFII